MIRYVWVSVRWLNVTLTCWRFLLSHFHIVQSWHKVGVRVRLMFWEILVSFVLSFPSLQMLGVSKASDLIDKMFWWTIQAALVHFMFKALCCLRLSICWLLMWIHMFMAHGTFPRFKCYIPVIRYIHQIYINAVLRIDLSIFLSEITASMLFFFHCEGFFFFYSFSGYSLE